MPATGSTAIEAQAQALDAFDIDGIRHNIPFLSALMQHPRWREGRLSTGFIAEEFPDGFSPLVAAGRDRACAGGDRGACRSRAATRASARFPASCARRGALHVRASSASSCSAKKRFDVEVAGARARTRHRFRRRARMRVDSPLDARASRCGAATSTSAGRGAGAPDPQRLRRSPMRGVGVEARVYTRREAELAALMLERKGADTSRALLCPMPGLVKSIAVRRGRRSRPASRCAWSRR